MLLLLLLLSSDQADPQNVRRTIHIFYAKKTSHLTHFEHFAADDDDRPQPLYDRFTGKLAPSTLLLVNVLTEKGCRSRFREKKIRGNTGITEASIYMFSLSSSSSLPSYLLLFHIQKYWELFKRVVIRYLPT